MRTLNVRRTSGNHGERAGYVHRSLPGCQPRLTAWHPGASERRTHGQLPMRPKGLRDNLRLIVAALALTPCNQRHGYQAGALSDHICRPPQARHLGRHASGNLRPAVVLQRVHELACNAARDHPGDGAHGPDERRQCLAPPTRIICLGVVRRGMTASGALRMREPRHSAPAELARRSHLSAERRGADGTDARQCEFHDRRAKAAAPCPQARRD